LNGKIKVSQSEAENGEKSLPNWSEIRFHVKTAMEKLASALIDKAK